MHELQLVLHPLRFSFKRNCQEKTPKTAPGKKKSKGPNSDSKLDRRLALLDPELRPSATAVVDSCLATAISLDAAAAAAAADPVRSSFSEILSKKPEFLL